VRDASPETCIKLWHWHGMESMQRSLTAVSSGLRVAIVLLVGWSK